MEASIKIMQLKSAREGNSNEKIIDYFKAEEIELLEQINDHLQGESAKLKIQMIEKAFHLHHG